MKQMFSDDNRVQTIAQHYGEEPQKNVVQEECAELIQAICKTRRYDDEQTRHHMIEEMSDLFLVLSTLNYYLTSEEKKYLIDNFNMKLDRQMERIEKEVKEQDAKEERLKLKLKCPCDSCPAWRDDWNRCGDYMASRDCITWSNWYSNTFKE